MQALARLQTQKLKSDDVSPLLFDIAGLSVEGLRDARRPLGKGFIPRSREPAPPPAMRQLPPLCH